MALDPVAKMSTFNLELFDYGVVFPWTPMLDQVFVMRSEEMANLLPRSLAQVQNLECWAWAWAWAWDLVSLSIPARARLSSAGTNYLVSQSRSGRGTASGRPSPHDRTIYRRVKGELGLPGPHQPISRPRKGVPSETRYQSVC